MDIHGTCDPRFAAVEAAFAANFEEGLDQGAAFAVYAAGRPVVDLWGGSADAEGQRPWARDTLVNVWSTTKGVVALALALLVERGRLDYEAPVARVWPEFGQNGKAEITLGCLLSHQAGLSAPPDDISLEALYGWHDYIAALEAMAPETPPGSLCVYHALSFGHLAGEILRRVDGRRIGAFVAQEIAGPLGISFFIGLPESEEGRVAATIAGPGADDNIVKAEEEPLGRGLINPRFSVTQPNDRAWRAAEIPAGNGQGDALGLARLYGALASGGSLEGLRLIGAEALAAATAERFRGTEASMGRPLAFGAGFMLNEGGGFGPSAGAFGHTGLGGSLAFADPDARVGVAYTPNRLLGFGDKPDPRRQRLIAAVYDSL